MSARETTKEMFAQADQMDRDANMLDSALLAPSMKSETLRNHAKELRGKANGIILDEARDAYSANYRG